MMLWLHHTLNICISANTYLKLPYSILPHLIMYRAFSIFVPHSVHDFIADAEPGTENAPRLSHVVSPVGGAWSTELGPTTSSFPVDRVRMKGSVSPNSARR